MSSPIELRLLAITERDGRPAVSLSGDGIPHHRVPVSRARREVTAWLDAVEGRERVESHRAWLDAVERGARGGHAATFDELCAALFAIKALSPEDVLRDPILHSGLQACVQAGITDPARVLAALLRGARAERDGLRDALRALHEGAQPIVILGAPEELVERGRKLCDVTWPRLLGDGTTEDDG